MRGALIAGMLAGGLIGHAQAQALPASTDGWLVHQNSTHDLSFMTPSSWLAPSERNGRDYALAYVPAESMVLCTISFDKAPPQAAHLAQDDLNRSVVSNGPMTEIEADGPLLYSELANIHGRYGRVFIQHRVAPKGKTRRDYTELLGWFLSPQGMYSLDCVAASSDAKATQDEFHRYLPTFVAILHSIDVIKR